MYSIDRHVITLGNAPRSIAVLIFRFPSRSYVSIQSAGK